MTNYSFGPGEPRGPNVKQPQDPYATPPKEHYAVLHGLCPVCGHYGTDCTGTKVSGYVVAFPLVGATRYFSQDGHVRSLSLPAGGREADYTDNPNEVQVFDTPEEASSYAKALGGVVWTAAWMWKGQQPTAAHRGSQR